MDKSITTDADRGYCWTLTAEYNGHTFLIAEGYEDSHNDCNKAIDAMLENSRFGTDLDTIYPLVG